MVSKMVVGKVRERVSQSESEGELVERRALVAM